MRYYIVDGRKLTEEEYERYVLTDALPPEEEQTPAQEGDTNEDEN